MDLEKTYHECLSGAKKPKIVYEDGGKPRRLGSPTAQEQDSLIPQHFDCFPCVLLTGAF